MDFKKTNSCIAGVWRLDWIVSVSGEEVTSISEGRMLALGCLHIPECFVCPFPSQILCSTCSCVHVLQFVWAKMTTAKVYDSAESKNSVSLLYHGLPFVISLFLNIIFSSFLHFFFNTVLIACWRCQCPLCRVSCSADSHESFLLSRSLFLIL